MAEPNRKTRKLGAMGREINGFSRNAGKFWGKTEKFQFPFLSSVPLFFIK